MSTGIRTRAATFAIVLALLPLGGCIKHVEKIVVADDGGVTMTVLATGDAADLSDGYALPRGERWKRIGKDGALWDQHVKPGDAAKPAVFNELPWRQPDGKPRGDVEVGVTAAFENVDRLPSTYAPLTDPYRDAAPAFRTTLTSRVEGTRRIYTFERIYRALPGAIQRIWKRAQADLEPIDRIFGAAELSRAEREKFADTFAGAMLAAGDLCVREGIDAHYLSGSAALSPALRLRVGSEVHDALARLVKREALITMLDAERARAAKSPAQPAPEPGPLAMLEREFRAAMRVELRAALDRTRLAAGETNGILHAFELAIARHDHTQDLGDENFEIEITLPGTIVAGNWKSVDGATARFEFVGEDLFDHDVIVRAVSVVESQR